MGKLCYSPRKVGDIVNFLIMLLICSVTGSLAAVIFWILSPILSKRCSAKWLYITWIVIIIAYLIPIRPVLDLRAFSPVSPVVTTQEKLTALAAYPDQVGKEAAGVFPMYSYYDWILYIWVIGFLVAAGSHVIRHIRFVKMVHCSSEKANNLTAEVLEQVSAKLGIHNTVQVQICPCISSPLIIGCMKPKILLPTDDFPVEELTIVFQRELIHFKNKDLWWKAVALLATAIHWFNPIVYLAARAADFRCELACDKAVMYGAARAARQQYGEMILAMVGKHNKFQSFLAIDLHNGEQKAGRRIFYILNTKRKRAGASVAVGTVVCLILTGAAFSGYVLPPSMQYYERKWNTNAQWNGKLYSDELKVDANTPKGGYPFLEAIKISYFFRTGKAPSWLDHTGKLQLNVNSYHTIVLQAVNLKDISESNAFADDQLSHKYLEMKEKGFTDKKPQQSEYTYTIELPEHIADCHVADFYKGPDGSTPREQDYYVTYKQDGTVFTAHFTPEQLKFYNQGIEQTAKKSVENFAKKIGMELPDHFQDNIEIYRN